MKDNKDLNLIGELKAQLNPPKTETRIILETEDLYPDLSQRSNKSKLSPAARQKIVNHNKPYQSQNQDFYGPCIPFNQNCECSLEQLQRQEQILKNREIEERIRRENGENIQQQANNQEEEVQRLRNDLEVQRIGFEERINILAQVYRNIFLKKV